VVVAFGAVGSIPATPFTTAAATSMAVPYPSGIVTGQPLILAAMNTSPVAWNTPSGWLLKESNASVNADLSFYVFTKIADGTESGSLTVSHTGSAVNAGAIVRYSGCDAVSPFGDTASNVSGSATTGPSPAPGTLSPAPGTSDMVVRFWGTAQNSGATGGSMTNPGGTWNTRLNLYTNVGSSAFNGGIVIADKINGTDSQTITCSPSSGWMVVDVVLKVAAAVNTDKFMPFFV
jgi:hypothetical protein